ncbi:MAG: type II toxin-antitoxin system VapB family antitoxin [Ilumatobacteraceae bacterium]
MAMNLKSEEAHRLSRELAALTGESITTAVTVAVRERLERVRQTGPTTEQRAQRILELGRQIAGVMSSKVGIDVDDLYDDQGLPA